MVFSFRVVWRGIAPLLETRNPARRLHGQSPLRCSQRVRKAIASSPERNAICLFGGGIDRKSGRVIVFPALAVIAFRVRMKPERKSHMTLQRAQVVRSARDIWAQPAPVIFGRRERAGPGRRGLPSGVVALEWSIGHD